MGQMATDKKLKGSVVHTIVTFASCTIGMVSGLLGHGHASRMTCPSAVAAYMECNFKT
jgi:hypothetical protein